MKKLYVIKIGGEIIEDEKRLSEFLQQFSQLPGNRILVHGGGKTATQMAEKLGIPQQMSEGRRITDEKTLELVTMVYAGLINKNIVAKLQAFHCNAIGITGADGNSIEAHKRSVNNIDYGFAGDVDKVNHEFFMDLFEKGLTPVIAPITHDGKGQLLNTNADTIAQEIGQSLSTVCETELVYSFGKEGVLKNVEDNNSVINKIDPAQYRSMKEEGSVFAGMIPKLDNAFAALNYGVRRVIIGNADKLNDLLAGRSGTSIVNE